MTHIRKIIGWTLGIVAGLMIVGQTELINPILDFGFDISTFSITVQTGVMIAAAYYLIKN